MRSLVVAILVLLVFLFMVMVLHAGYGDSALVGILAYLLITKIEPLFPS